MHEPVVFTPIGPMPFRPELRQNYSIVNPIVSLGNIGAAILRWKIDWIGSDYSLYGQNGVASAIKAGCMAGIFDLVFDVAMDNRSGNPFASLIGLIFPDKHVNLKVPNQPLPTAAANYDEFPLSVGPDFYQRTKVVDALSLVKEWGWSNAMLNVRSLSSGWFFDHTLGGIPNATAFAFPGNGDIGIARHYLDVWDASRLAFQLIHEGLHQRLYEYAFDLYDHHLLTSMVTIVTAMSLWTQAEKLASPGKWPQDWNDDIDSSGTPSKAIDTVPDLRFEICATC